MKTLIVGTGIIGTIYGWALAEAGVDITHYVRKGRSTQYEDGVTLDLLDERKGHAKYTTTQYPLKCVEAITPADGYELILVPTNSYQVAEVLTTLAPQAGKAIFLTFAANWEGTEFIDRLLPRDRYLMGYPDGGGTRRNGVYWTNLGAEVHLGVVDTLQLPALEQVKQLFLRADMQPDVQDNIVHWLWVHNALSVGIWAGFAKYRDVKPFLKDRSLLLQCYAATQELLELCRLRGVNLKQYPETGTFRMPAWLFIILLRWLWTHNESMQRFTAHGADSLEEAKALYMQTMQTADELDFAMPNMRAVGVHLEAAHKSVTGPLLQDIHASPTHV